MKKEKALILFSGGLDSTTSLYWAREQFGDVAALVFSYSQKHDIEVKMAEKIARRLGIRYHVVDFSLKELAKSALIDENKEIPPSFQEAKDGEGIPYTYVPFRNGIFLSIAAAYGESHGFYNLVTGFNQIDTPDYPDTTETFTQKMEDAINQGTFASAGKFRFQLHTPLVRMTKVEIIRFGLKMGADYSYSVSCYRGGEIPCLACPSCDIRNGAFIECGLEDPLIQRLKKENRY